MVKKLPLKIFIIYGIGCFGWSISINLISVLLNYIYLPPSNTGMKNLVPQVAYLGFISVISIVLFVGRAFDAIVDPILAHLSDKNRSKLGRRIPFMRYSFIPLSIFSTLIFFPIHHHENKINIYWLAGTQLFFYFFFGMYTISYNALLADIGQDDKTKLNLSTAQSIGFMVGTLMASFTTVAVELLMRGGVTSDKLLAYQMSVLGLNVIGMICLAVPAFFLDEKKYAAPAKSAGGMFDSLKTTLANKNFRIFALADASYFMSVSIISAGLLYYVTAMLHLKESIGMAFILAMVIITLLCYGLVNWLGKKISKKKLMIISFAAAAVVFSEIFFLGKVPISPYLQAGILVLTFGIPNAFLQILPNTIVADISHEDIKETSQNKEGMFFGMRAFFQKIGQTGGVTLFAMLTIWGKDPGHDLGLRLSGVAGAVLCAMAAIAYTRFKEVSKHAKKA